MATFEIYRDGAGWAWRLNDADGNRIAVSNWPFRYRVRALRAIDEVRVAAPTAEIVDLTGE